jgi:hypothetical protein
MTRSWCKAAGDIDDAHPGRVRVTNSGVAMFVIDILHTTFRPPPRTPLLQAAKSRHFAYSGIRHLHPVILERV